MISQFDAFWLGFVIVLGDRRGIGAGTDDEVVVFSGIGFQLDFDARGGARARVGDCLHCVIYGVSIGALLYTVLQRCCVRIECDARNSLLWVMDFESCAGAWELGGDRVEEFAKSDGAQISKYIRALD